MPVEITEAKITGTVSGPMTISAGDSAKVVALADNVEADRVVIAEDIEAERVVRASTIRKQMWFLFGFVILLSLSLGYRNETVSNEIEQTSYNSCMARATLAKDYNAGRESLIQWILTNPSSTRTPEQRDDIARQLRDGLLLPVENCGERP